jgi:TDG/mug DNA glycosylase family protein
MLPDLFTTDLRLIICGTAPGEISAQRKQYYAKPGNKFWATLYEVGLTPKKLDPADYQQLLQYGIGLTDLVKNKAGMDRSLQQTDFDRAPLIHVIHQYQPRYLCFNGKKAAQEFFLHPVSFGLQESSMGQTKFFVAPSTSGAANKWWDIEIWKELARLEYATSSEE